MPVWVRATLGVGRPQMALPQALLPLASWQVGPNLIPWVHLSWHAHFLWFVGLFYKCNTGLDHLCISSVFTCVFFVNQLWVPADYNSPKLVKRD